MNKQINSACQWGHRMWILSVTFPDTRRSVAQTSCISAAQRLRLRGPRLWPLGPLCFALQVTSSPSACAPLFSSLARPLTSPNHAASQWPEGPSFQP